MIFEDAVCAAVELHCYVDSCFYYFVHFVHDGAFIAGVLCDAALECVIINIRLHPLLL